MLKKTIPFFLLCISIIISCQNNDQAKSNEEESCTNPIKDPNDVKPMARMMRTMANYCDSMRLQINQGQQVDSVKYPLMPFWTAEPTDSSVLETLFFDNAKMFENAYRKLMSEKANQAANYTAVINTCVNCHMSYCSGPLKRIKKLPLDYK